MKRVFLTEKDGLVYWLEKQKKRKSVYISETPKTHTVFLFGRVVDATGAVSDVGKYRVFSSFGCTCIHVTCYGVDCLGTYCTHVRTLM